MINQAHNFLLWLVFIGVNSNWLDTSNYKYAPHLLIVAYFKTAKCFSTLTKTVNPTTYCLSLMPCLPNDSKCPNSERLILSNE